MRCALSRMRCDRTHLPRPRRANSLASHSSVCECVCVWVCVCVCVCQAHCSSVEHDDDFAYDCSTVEIEVEPLPEGVQEHQPPCHSFYHTTNEPLSSLYTSPFTLDGICARISLSLSVCAPSSRSDAICALVYYLSLYLHLSTICRSIYSCLCARIGRLAHLPLHS